MGKRAVFLERSWVDVAGAVGLFHYAVKVEDDDHWYEIQGGSTGSSSSRSSKGGAKRNTINGEYDGNPRRNTDRDERTLAALTLVGSTHKDDREIRAFNLAWMKKSPCYNALYENCQKYASQLIQYLVGGSFKMDMPLSSTNAYAYGPASHEVFRDGYNQTRTTTGKAGVQIGYVAAEVEGPSSGVEESEYFAGFEASLGRVEAQLVGVGARLEPNVNTGIGFTGGQVKLKAAGFGFTAGKGFAIHTPLGSLGFGRF